MSEGEQPIAGFLQAVGDRAVLDPPFANERFAPSFDFGRRGRVDHVGIVGADFLMQTLGRVREQIAKLMNGTLHWHAVPHGGKRLFQSGRAVNDEKRRPLEITLDQIIEHRAPGFGEFAAHILDRKQHLLSVRTHPDDNKQGDRGGLAIEPDPNNRAVEDQPHDRLGGE